MTDSSNVRIHHKNPTIMDPRSVLTSPAQEQDQDRCLSSDGSRNATWFAEFCITTLTQHSKTIASARDRSWDRPSD